MAPATPTSDPITVALKPLMRERKLTYRALADLTRAADAEGRGVTSAYLCALTSGREYPSQRSIELIAASLDVEPSYFAEHRLAELRRELNGREVGFATAWRRYSQLVHLTASRQPTADSIARSCSQESRARNAARRPSIVERVYRRPVRTSA